MTTPRRRSRRKLTGPWMNLLAARAAESRADGGAGLVRLLRRAKWSERTQVSLTKREAA